MAERNHGNEAEGIHSYPYTLSDDAWAEGFVSAQKQEQTDDKREFLGKLPFVFYMGRYL